MSTVKRGPFYEYSVVYTDRVYNLMSPPFQEAMRDISASLKRCYNADACVLVPGSGSFGMEAVARAFGTGKKCLVVRNGYFSYRWSDIFSICEIPSAEVVLKARPSPGQENEKFPFVEPVPAAEVAAAILKERPALVCMPHVETSTGIILSDEYIAAVALAAHEVGALVIVDGIAAGTVWLDMKKVGADAYVTAPQKGWSGPACVGIVMLGEKGVAATKANKGKSFCCNLQEWLDVMEKYENKDGKGPGFRYYTTLPTDALMVVRDAIKEAEAIGLEKLRGAMWDQGRKVRAALKARGFKSVAADHCAAPGVVVVYSAQLPNALGKFKAEGLQIAGGVNWMLDQEKWPHGGVDCATQTWRLGLFGLDKLNNVDGSVKRLSDALDNILAKESGAASSAPAAAPKPAEAPKSTPDLSLQAANAIIAGCFAKAAQSNFKPLTVVVLDAGGHVKAVQKQDGSSMMRFEIASGKAYGALAVGLGSRWLNAQAATRPHFLEGLSAVSGGKIVAVPGGVLIKQDGKTIGAVGITGDTSDNDEAAAVAGIQSVGLTAVWE